MMGLISTLTELEPKGWKSWLAFMSFVAHVLLAIGIVTQLGTIGQSPVWQFISQFMPLELWPMMFMAIGILACVGVWHVDMFRASLWLGGATMLVWGIATIAYSIQQSFFVSSGPWLIYVGMLKIMVAAFSLKAEKVREATKDIPELLEGVKNGHAAE